GARQPRPRSWQMARRTAAEPRQGCRDRRWPELLQPGSLHHQVRHGEPDRSRDLRRPAHDQGRIRRADAALARSGNAQGTGPVRTVHRRLVRQGRHPDAHRGHVTATGMIHGMKRSLALLAMLPVLLAVRVVDAGDADFKSGVFDPPSAAPDFQLQGSNGAPIVLSKFRGTVVAIAFGFTHRERICPVTLATLSAAFKKLGPAAADVQVIFVSVDPDRDSPDRLREYLQSFNPSFLGAT